MCIVWLPQLLSQQTQDRTGLYCTPEPNYKLRF